MTRARRLRRPTAELARSAFADRVRGAARSADVLHLEEVETAWLNDGIGVPSLLRSVFHSLGPGSGRSVETALPPHAGVRARGRVAIRRHDCFIPASPPAAGEIRRRPPDAKGELVPVCLDPADYPPPRLTARPQPGSSVRQAGRSPRPPSAARTRPVAGGPELAPAARLVVAGRDTKTLGLAGAGVEVVGEVPSASVFSGASRFSCTPGEGKREQGEDAGIAGLRRSHRDHAVRRRRRRRRDGIVVATETRSSPRRQRRY